MMLNREISKRLLLLLIIIVVVSFSVHIGLDDSIAISGEVLAMESPKTATLDLSNKNIHLQPFSGYNNVDDIIKKEQLGNLESTKNLCGPTTLTNILELSGINNLTVGKILNTATTQSNNSMTPYQFFKELGNLEKSYKSFEISKDENLIFGGLTNSNVPEVFSYEKLKSIYPTLKKDVFGKGGFLAAFIRNPELGGHFIIITNMQKDSSGDNYTMSIVDPITGVKDVTLSEYCFPPLAMMDKFPIDIYTGIMGFRTVILIL